MPDSEIDQKSRVITVAAVIAVGFGLASPEAFGLFGGFGVMWLFYKVTEFIADVQFVSVKEKSIAMDAEKSSSKREAERKKKAEYRERKRREKEEKYKSLEKAAKIKAFKRKNFQSGHSPPTNSQKERAWTPSTLYPPRCIDCSVASITRETSFWWRIYPKLEVVLLCDECAEKDGLVEERETVDERRSRRIPEDVKDAVWRRDEGRCLECGSNEDLEFDHIIPHSKGGSNNKRNIQLLCESCNRKKSDNIG